MHYSINSQNSQFTTSGIADLSNLFGRISYLLPVYFSGIKHLYKMRLKENNNDGFIMPGYTEN